jgi:glycosyltransferase involved in cell wall biosynthesis
MPGNVEKKEISIYCPLRIPTELNMANSKHRETVTIIVPFQKNYNFLEEACLSIINQTHQNWVAVLVADNADFESMEIATKYITLDSRFKLIMSGRKNCDAPGPWLARNQALREIQSCYVSFLDSDDIWHPQKLELQLKHCKKYNLDLCTASYIRFNTRNMRVNEQRKPPQTIKLGDIFPVNKIPLSSTLIRIDALNNYMFRATPHEDQDLWYQIFSQDESLRAGNLNKVLMAYRIHHSNYTKGIRKKLTLKLSSLINYEKRKLASSACCCFIAIVQSSISKFTFRLRVRNIYDFGFLQEK